MPGDLPPALAGPLLTRLPAAVRAGIRTRIAWPEAIPAAAGIAHEDAAFIAWFYDPRQADAIAARVRTQCPGPGTWWAISGIDWDRNPCPQLTPAVLDACAEAMAADSTPAETSRVMAIALMGRVAPYDTGDAATRLTVAILRIAQVTQDQQLGEMIRRWRVAPTQVGSWERIYEQAVLRGRWDDPAQLARWDGLATVPATGPAPAPAPASNNF